MPDKSHDEERIFAAAAEIESADQRASFLDQQCGDNHELRERIEALLRRHDESHGMLDAPPPGVDRTHGMEDGGLAANAASSALPERVGRYRIQHVVGTGGFGVVYLAHDEQLDRPVAVKVPHAALASQAQNIDAYLAEARTVARLDHPRIVPVYDAGVAEGIPWYVVSKYVEGADLATTLQSSRPTHRESAELVATIAEALHYAHLEGLVHRDVKPGNIIIGSDGQPHIVDFGLALREENVGKGPRRAGTPAYMSPEQARGEGHRVDGRSDIFSLGVILYELLVGRRPFSAETDLELLEQITAHEPRPLRQRDDTIPKELERICQKAISKRASERYSTASDMAEDLRLFLEEQASTANSSGDSRPGITVMEASSETHTPSADSTTGSAAGSGSSWSSGSQVIRVVPKGLRSFDEHDADFFWSCCQDRGTVHGWPDSIRFWKNRVEETDPHRTFPVGLIYGPSGCGKSSLVKAGLLPRLSTSVIAIYIEASANETEQRLLNGLQQKCGPQFNAMSLKDGLAAARRGEGLPAGKKVLLVVDQFEQWLHANRDRHTTELMQALRQCDGGRLQCILMVRDDFWLAISRFLQQLEVGLVEGENSALADLFDVDHAKRVLSAFGRAFGRLPESPKETSADQKRFLREAIVELSDDGKVVSVRLALFAEMMKSKSWTPATLRQVGGTAGVGATFLEETFSAATAPPNHRRHQKAARAILRSLLPNSGVDIKGHMRSRDELLAISGYADRRHDFDEVMSILDREVRLITPTDPEGREVEDDAEARSVAEQPCYQLTHDYLVHSLRDWLTRKQKETVRGRAELRLEERSAAWSAKPENRLLPSVVDYLNLRLLTRKGDWTKTQRTMMGKAARVHIIRATFATLLIATAAWAGIQVRDSLIANGLIDSLLNADTAQVPAIVQEIALRRQTAVPRLRTLFDQADSESTHKLHAALALHLVDESKASYLLERLLDGTPTEHRVIRDALDRSESTAEQLWNLATDASTNKARRFRAGCALASLELMDDPRWNKVVSSLAESLVQVPPTELAAWRDALGPVQSRLVPPLAAIYRDTARGEQERLFATNVLAHYLQDDADDLFDLFVDANRAQFVRLFPAVAAHQQRCIELAKSLIRQRDGSGGLDTSDVAARRRANAGVMLFRMSVTGPVWPLLKHSPDPRTRSYLIHWLSSHGADPRAIVDRLENETDVTIRRALILSLGEFDVAKWPILVRPGLTANLVAIYENEPDAGLHSAARWLLKHWQQDGKLEASDAQFMEENAEFAGDTTVRRGWRVNSQGQTIVAIEALEPFEMGSPDSERGRTSADRLHPRRIGRRFEMSATEVTRQQYTVFAEDTETINYAAPYFTPTLDSPQVLVTWYEAVKYCNWLSEKEGIPEDQWCYEPNDSGEYATGMRTRSVELSGYRLPTEAEWEFACRAGSRTRYSFGNNEELLSKYGWWANNSESRSQPVGLLKPNDFGLFDMHGNVFEWCHDRWDAVRGRTQKSPAHVDDVREVLGEKHIHNRRGGFFREQPAVLRSANRDRGPPTLREYIQGVRLARTLR